MAGLVCSATFNAIGGGIGSGIFAWFMNATGIAQSVAKTTAPLFQNAFYYGAMNGAIQGVVYNISTQTQMNARIENRGVLLAWNASVFALVVLARYGIAEACNQSFKANISSRFVHIGTVFHVVMSPCSLLCQTGITGFLNEYRNNPQGMQELQQRLRAGQF